MIDFSGKVVLVTGGLSGIGLATAREFQSNGASVIVTSRSPEYVDAFNKNESSNIKNPIEAIVSDVSNREDNISLYNHIDNKYGALHVLCPNAGCGFWNNVEEVNNTVIVGKTAESELIEQVNTNFIGCVYSIEEGSDLLIKTAGKSTFSPSIVVVASTAGHKGLANMPVYAATKAAQRSLTRSYASQLIGHNIRVNCVSPGGIETEFWGKINCNTAFGSDDNVISGDAALGSVAEHFTNLTPLNRFGKPEEIAKAIIYLASEQSPYQYGTELIVDGGFTQI